MSMSTFTSKKKKKKNVEPNAGLELANLRSRPELR